jgi:hypothetical protein
MRPILARRPVAKCRLQALHKASSGGPQGAAMEDINVTAKGVRLWGGTRRYVDLPRFKEGTHRRDLEENALGELRV